MAVFPLPVGIAAMMKEIAEGIATAGRVLPETSRSEVGALAVHRAKVEIAFELSSVARSEGATVGIGMRSFLFGPSTATGLNEQTGHNTGRITLEIVAVTAPELAIDAKPKPAPKPTRPTVAPPAETPAADPEAEKLRIAIGRMRDALPALDLSDADRKQVEALVGMAEAALAAGNLGAAREIIVQLAPGFAALDPDRNSVPGRTK